MDFSLIEWLASHWQRLLSSSLLLLLLLLLVSSQSGRIDDPITASNTTAPDAADHSKLVLPCGGGSFLGLDCGKTVLIRMGQQVLLTWLLQRLVLLILLIKGKGQFMPLLVDYLDFSRSQIRLSSHHWLILVNWICLTRSLLLLRMVGSRLSHGSHLLLLALRWVEDLVMRRLHRVGRNHSWVSLTHVHWALSALRRIHGIHRLLLSHSCLIKGNFAKDLELFISVCGNWGNCLASIKLFLVHDCPADVNAKLIAPVTDISEAEVQVIAREANPVANSLHQTLTRLAILQLLLVLDNLLIVRWRHHQVLLLSFSLVLDLGRALIEYLILVLDADVFEGAFNLTLAILAIFGAFGR